MATKRPLTSSLARSARGAGTFLALWAAASLLCTGCAKEVEPPASVPTTAAKAGGAEAIEAASSPGADKPEGAATPPAGSEAKAGNSAAAEGDAPAVAAATAEPTRPTSAADPAPAEKSGDKKPAPTEPAAAEAKAGADAAASGVAKPAAPGAVAARPDAAVAAPAEPEAVVEELPGLGSAGKAIAIRMKRTNPLPGIVDQAIGGATEPDSDPAVWVKAMHQMVRELTLVDKVRDKARTRSRAILEAGAVGRLPRGGALARGLAAHEIMVGALDGANARVRGERHLGSPLAGASERGRAFAGMATALGLAASDAIIAGKGALALTWCRRQARFGALASSVARSYEELAAGASAVQEALGLIEIVALRFPKAVASHDPPLDPEALRALRHQVGEFVAELSEQRAFMRDIDHLDDWARLAVDAPSAIWRYEALMALFGVALTRQGSDDASRAVARMEALAAQRTRPTMAAAAATQLKRVRR